MSRDENGFERDDSVPVIKEGFRKKVEEGGWGFSVDQDGHARPHDTPEHEKKKESEGK